MPIYSSHADALLAIQRQSRNGTHSVAMIDRTQELRGMSELHGQPSNALNIAFNDRANSLFIFDSATGAEPDVRLAAAASSARCNLRIPGLQRQTFIGP